MGCAGRWWRIAFAVGGGSKYAYERTLRVHTAVLCRQTGSKYAGVSFGRVHTAGIRWRASERLQPSPGRGSIERTMGIVGVLRASFSLL